MDGRLQQATRASDEPIASGFLYTYALGVLCGTAQLQEHVAVKILVWHIPGCVSEVGVHRQNVHVVLLFVVFGEIF